MPKKILIVEDNDFLREEIIAIVEETEQWIAFGVDSAEAAELTLLSDRFEVILADVNLPGMDGISLLRSAINKHPGIVGIICSGHRIPAPLTNFYQVPKEEAIIALPRLLKKLFPHENGM